MDIMCNKGSKKYREEIPKKGVLGCRGKSSL